MKVLINGLPLFASRLANDLSQAEPNSTFTFLDTYNSKWAKLKFFLMVPFCDLVISMNGVTDNSGALNWVLKRKKKLILQWMGTDISLAVDRNKNGTILRKYIDYADNFADGPWLKEEVDTIGIGAKLVAFKHVKSFQIPEKYAEISIMTYIAGSRADFYGYSRLVEAAMETPSIRFNVYGMDKPEKEHPSNIHFHGWSNETSYHNGLRKSAIFLRLTEHDGFAISVLEAQAYGCEVIWTYPGKEVHHLKGGANLAKLIQDVIGKIDKRGLKPNQAISEFVLEEYNKEKVINGYLHELKKCLE